MIIMLGCSNPELKIEKSNEEILEVEKSIEKTSESSEFENSEEGSTENTKPSISPKIIGEEFELDDSKYNLAPALTEDWEHYYKAQELLRKELLSTDGEFYDDSVLFFECGSDYIAIVSDKEDFSSTYMAILDKTDDTFDIKFVDRFKYSFNSAKEEIFVKDDELVIVTQFPFSSYSLFGKFTYAKDSIIYESLFEYDSSISYYNEFMELLEEGAMDDAMKLEDYSSYPFSYEMMYFKSGNLAIKKSLEFARVESLHGNDEKSKELLEWGLSIYLEKHYNYEFDIENPAFENIYVKKSEDFGYEYVLSNDFIFEYLDFYLSVYSKNEDKTKVDGLLMEINKLKDILKKKSE